MNCRQIFEAALSLIGIPVNSANIHDYEERALKLFFVVLMQYRSLSTAICGTDHKVHTLFINTLDTGFPLDQRTMPAACYTLASLLIIDELPDLAAELEQRASEAVAEISKEVVEITPITEVY